jgi:hypothetical protein
MFKSILRHAKQVIIYMLLISAWVNVKLSNFVGHELDYIYFSRLESDL